MNSEEIVRKHLLSKTYEELCVMHANGMTAEDIVDSLVGHEIDNHMIDEWARNVETDSHKSYSEFLRARHEEE